MAPQKMNKTKSTLTMIINILIIICSVFHAISATSTQGVDNYNRDNLHFNTSSLSFGNNSIFSRKILNISLINPTNNVILIDKYYINDTQFTVKPVVNNNNYIKNKQLRLSSNSSVSFNIIFSPISIGKYWSHLSVHTDNGVLYLYLYGVGLDNKYRIEPIYLNTSKYEIIIPDKKSRYTFPKKIISITNPFRNKTLIVYDMMLMGPLSFGRGLTLGDLKFNKVNIDTFILPVLAQKRK